MGAGSPVLEPKPRRPNPKKTYPPPPLRHVGVVPVYIKGIGTVFPGYDQTYTVRLWASLAYKVQVSGLGSLFVWTGRARAPLGGRG